MTKNYNQPFLVLLHDESAYENLFGGEFPNNGNTGEFRLEALHKKEIKEELYPIVYYAEKLPVYAATADEQYEIIFELIEILAETETKEYFLCGFIQRLVDFMWDSQLVKFYNVVSAMYISSFILILMTTIILRWQKLHPIGAGKLRIALMSVNMFILLLSEVTFEVKSLINEGLAYFDSFYNKNDIMLFLLSVACLAQEILLYKDPNNVVGEYSETFMVDELYQYGLREQILRITYSVLLVSVNIKIMAVLQFYESIAFMVEIMENISGAMAPVIAFFVWFIIMFAMAANSLDVVFYTSGTKNTTGDYTGITIWGAHIITMFHNSLADFKVWTYKFLPWPQKYVIWPLWIFVVALNLLVVVNLNIQVIESVLKAVNKQRIEEAYQKRCGVLCELNGVFGKLARPKHTNVLITRLSTDQKESQATGIDKSAIELKKLLALNKIEVL